MARIKNIDLPKDKRIVIALTYIQGIGKSTASKICKDAKVSEDIKTKDLSSEQVNKLREEVDKYPVGGDLRREKDRSIKNLMEIGCYRGMRHRKGLPVRGQRTRTNCHNSKAAGKRKVVANKKK